MKFPRPLFTWITVEGTVDENGAFSGERREQLVTDIAAAADLVAAVGARQWRLLETLAWHSEPDPEHAHRRVIRATIAQIAALAGGPDSGWSESTISPVLRDMEDRGLLVRILGRRLGRQKGSAPTSFLLADGLFARPAARTQQAAAHDAGLHGTEPETYSPQNPRPVKPSPSPRDKSPQNLRPVKTGAPHGEHGMSNPFMDTMAVIADETAVATVLAARLRAMGWNTDVTRDIRKWTLPRLAAWTIFVEHAAGVRNKGALLRTRIAEGTWPDGWQQGTVIDAMNGQLRATAPTAASVPAVPTMKQLEKILDQLPEQVYTRITSMATQTVSAKIARGALAPEQRSSEWRSIVHDLLLQHERTTDSLVITDELMRPGRSA